MVIPTQRLVQLGAPTALVLATATVHTRFSLGTLAIGVRVPLEGCKLRRSALEVLTESPLQGLQFKTDSGHHNKYVVYTLLFFGKIRGIPGTQIVDQKFRVIKREWQRPQLYTNNFVTIVFFLTDVVASH
ncbi:hypothetical protein EBU95_13685 [bacterium]|nr:hypothetical protein [bacterium]